jgi:hypothetical protein
MKGSSGPSTTGSSAAPRPDAATACQSPSLRFAQGLPHDLSQRRQLAPGLAHDGPHVDQLAAPLEAGGGEQQARLGRGQSRNHRIDAEAAEQRHHHRAQRRDRE